ncbi:MAG: glycosyltransferase, partial [Candidatus Thermoplasmatota archaeon]|nr:glycosyltransferase [Candidatus Thermoplasmatota archaeon]
HPFIHFYNLPGSKSHSRNLGVSKATGEFIAFVDSDTIINPLWCQEIERAFDETGTLVVAGREVRLGYEGWSKMKRVATIYKGQDISYPSVNLALRKDFFDKIGGFDPWFKDAEDIDLNYRAVENGATIYYASNAIVYHRVRETIKAFFKQSFWFGFGRKELTLRHGNLWQSYDLVDMVKIGKEESIWKIIRLVVGAMGYFTCKFTKNQLELKRKWRESEISSRL